MDIELRSARLTLRRARPEDLDGLHALASDYEVVKQTATWPWPPDRAFTATRAQPFDPAKGLVGPVFLGDALIGMMGVSEELSEGGPAIGGLGYMFARAHWGQGYATEIGQVLLDHAWARYDWPAIAADALADNPASARVLLKLGFTEGPLRTGTSAAQGRADLPLRSFRLDRPVGVARHG